MAAIKHIEFWVSDLEKSLAFYRGLFNLIGWEQVDANGFKLDGAKIYFKEVPDIRMQTSLGPRHICFGVGKRRIVDNVGDYLRVCNARIIRGPVEITDNKYSSEYYTVDFNDPDGYILEVAYSPHSGT